MREIKFRGRKVDKDEFAYGDHLTGMGYKKGKHYILPLLPHYPSDCHSLDGYEVIPETVGQYTGLKDKNGKEIYEGDIIFSNKCDGRAILHKVEYNEENAMFVARPIQGLDFDFCQIHQSWIDKYGKEVIDNIYNNPELIKE